MGADDPGRGAAPRGGRLSQTQPVLFGRRPRRSTPGADGAAAEVASGPLVAQVCVDAPGPHLDHSFSYVVPQRLVTDVRPGVRVSVPFAGSDVPGWVLALDGRSPSEPGGDPVGEAQRPLRALRRVVSPVAVLDPVVATVARLVADHYAGTLADVLRTAVPPRHARAEAAFREAVAGTPAAAILDGVPAVPGPARPRPPGQPVLGSWGDLTGGPALLHRIAAGQGPAAAACLPTTADPWQALAVLASHAVPRTTLVLVPDAADMELAAAAVTAHNPGARVVVIHHDLGPAARWRAFLQILTGLADVVIGTRSAAFAPLPGLGVVAVWDDGDDAHAEPRSPGWHVRVVAAQRARAAGAALVLAAHARSAATQQLVATGACKSLEAPRPVRRRAPRVFAPNPDDPLQSAARVPRSAHQVIAEGLRRGPVLVSVPRRGYAPGLACGHCRAPAWCRHCHGGRLAVTSAGAEPACSWCGRADAQWACGVCGATALRAAAVGGRRTAEELGRTFPGHPVVTSDGSGRVHAVPANGALVVATPGAEPVAAGGYAAAAILDGDSTLARPGLAAGEDTVRRWLHVVSLVRPTAEGGTVVLVADPTAAAVAAVVAASPERYAQRVLAERTESGLPPSTVAAALLGDRTVVAEAAAWLRGEPPLAEGTISLWSAEPAGGVAPAAGNATVQVLGPVPTGQGRTPEQARLLVLGERAAVVDAMRDVLRRRAARHIPGALTVRVDPIEL